MSARAIARPMWKCTPARVHLEQRQRGLGLVDDPDAGAAPAGLGRAQRAVQALEGRAGVHGDRVGAVAARRRALHDLGAELLGDGQAGRIVVEVGHALGAERHAPRPPRRGRCSAPRRPRPARAPSGRSSRAGATVRHPSTTLSLTLATLTGSSPSGTRQEHGVGEGHAQQVRQRSAPVAADHAEAVHGVGGHGLAVAGQTAAAGAAVAAGDLERDRHHVPGADAGHLIADVHDLRHAFVARGRSGPGSEPHRG